MNNYLKTIREKCIEANKEIVELKFGCEVKIKSVEELGIPDFKGVFVQTGRAKKYESYEIWFSGAESGSQLPYSSFIQSKDVEIIGRPITLADVLLAIKKFSDTSIYIRHDGVFFKWEKFNEGGDGHHGVESTYIEWNLKEALENQSEETLKFIAELLN